MLSVIVKIIKFYIDGFKSLSDWGKKVWIIIFIKLFIIFVILRLFFFHDFLGKGFSNNRQRSEYVINQLTNLPGKDD